MSIEADEAEDLAALKRALARAKAAIAKGATRLGTYVALVEDCIARQEALTLRERAGELRAKGG